MAVSKTFNGVTYTLPQTGDSSWGDEVSTFLVAVAEKALSLSGGTRELTADLNFGASAGIVVQYVKSRGTNISTTGVVRLSNNESVAWRNFANGADLLLRVNASDILEFNGNPVFTLALGTADTVLRMNAAGTAYEYVKLVDANIGAAAAIAYSKLNLTTSIVNADINASAAIAYSKLALGTSIVNADISASAAIAYSKLSLGTSIVNADINAAAAIAYSKLNLATSIVNADVSASAAIVDTKLETIATALKVSNSATTAASANTASAIVARDGSGNFIASTITANLTGNASGTAANVTGTVAIANGGTGAATKAPAFDALSPMTTAGDLVRGGASGTGTRVAVGVEGQSLRVVSGVPAWADGGAGSGNLNLITNPSAASDATTGVTNGTSHTTARVSGANSPLNTAIPTAFELTATATAVESATSGVRWTYTVPAAIRNTKLRVGFSYTVQASQTWSVSVRNAAGRLVLNTDVSSASILANSTATVTGNFSASFDSDSATGNYTVNITRTAGSGTAILYVTNLAVDAGTIINAAPIGPWIAYTPSSVSGLGTPSAFDCHYRQVGDSAELSIRITSGTVTAAGIQVRLPTGLTGVTRSINRLLPGNVSTNYAGGTQSGMFPVLASAFPLDIQVGRNNSASILTAVGGNTILNTGDILYITATVPIAEWAGAPNYAGQNDVEYASNSSAFDSTDTTSFQYGPNGAAGINTSLGANRNKTVRFLTPFQAGETPQLQYLVAGVWINQSESNSPWTTASLVGFGANTIPQANGTDVIIQFYRFAVAGTTYNSLTGALGWDVALPGTRWRVVKSRAGVALGFGLATATQSGLVAASGSIGTTRLGGQSGYGSDATNLNIRRFTTVITNTSTDVTLAQSGTLGDTFTIVRAGLYSISYTDACSGSCNMGISRNSSQLSTNIATITQANRLFLMSPTANDAFLTGSITMYLAAGDVLRAHGDRTSAASSTERTQITIQRIY